MRRYLAQERSPNLDKAGPYHPGHKTGSEARVNSLRATPRCVFLQTNLLMT